MKNGEKMRWKIKKDQAKNYYNLWHVNYQNK